MVNIKKIFVIVMVFWGILSTCFFIRIADPMITLSTLKDNYKSAVLNNPQNDKYQKDVYEIYKEHVRYFSESDDKVISWYYSMDDIKRIPVLFLLLFPYVALISYIISLIGKSNNKKHLDYSEYKKMVR